MARPGFVLEVDDRTPPVVVPDGDGFRMERFPLGTRVVYPADSLPTRARRPATPSTPPSTHPLESAPLAERLRPGMRLTIAFDDNTVPVPGDAGAGHPRPDHRGRAHPCRGGGGRRRRADLRHRAEPSADPGRAAQRLVGERVFRSFFADGLLTNHDAEDLEEHTAVGATEAGCGQPEHAGWPSPTCWSTSTW